MNKYGNKKIEYCGEVFDSKRECYRYMDLKLLESCGAISDLRRQVTYELIPAQREKSTKVYKKGAKKGQPIEGKIIEKAVTYRADFTYIDNATEWVIKRKLMLYIHGIKVREV